MVLERSRECWFNPTRPVLARSCLIASNWLNRRQRRPIAISNAVPRNRRHAIPRNENSHQVQRIGSRQRNRCLRRVQLAHSPHRLDRNRQSKLFAHETIDKAAAANLSAIFQPAKCHQQFAPWRQIRFARQHIANHNSITPQQHPASRFHRPRPLHNFLGMQQSPPPSAMPRTRHPPASLPRPPLGIDQRSQIVESVRRHQPGRHQLPQRSLNLRLQLASTAHNIRKKRRPTLPQKIQHKLRAMTQSVVL